MTKDENFHTIFEALSAKMQDHCSVHELDAAIMLVGLSENESAVDGNVCRPCMARVLLMTLVNLASTGVTPATECDNTDDISISVRGDVVGHA